MLRRRPVVAVSAEWRELGFRILNRFSNQMGILGDFMGNGTLFADNDRFPLSAMDRHTVRAHRSSRGLNPVP
jgi:hypothetical protein